MNPELEMTVMNLVVDSGSGRSFAMEAIAFAKDGEFDKADEALENADNEIRKAHHAQTDLIQREAGGEKIEFSLMIAHSQDHLMTAMAVRDLAKEIVELHRRMSK